jgi:ribonucleoside-diphosphate reductase alpha subunit
MENITQTPYNSHILMSKMVENALISDVEMSAILESGNNDDECTPLLRPEAISSNDNMTNVPNQANILESIIKSIIYKHAQYVDTRWVNMDGVYEYVRTTVPSDIKLNDLYNYISDYCASKMSTHPDYNVLASRICIDRLHSVTKDDILTVAEMLYSNVDMKGREQPLINEHLYNTIKKSYKKINEKIDMSRDYLLDYFGIRTLERSYLLKTYDKNNKKVIVERPQHMFMRVALGIHGSSLKCAFETYDLMSQKYMTHATPTLFNAGTPCPQLSSCFLENTEVFTLNDGIKFIQDVKIGDEIVSHTGKVQKVEQLHKNLLNGRKICKLVVNKTKEIYVTDNHKFLSTTDKKTSGWNSVANLKVGQHIAIPNYKGDDDCVIIDILDYLADYTKSTGVKMLACSDEKSVWMKSEFTHSNLSNSKCPTTITHLTNKVNRYWTFDADFTNLIGMFLGDGNIITKKYYDERTCNGIAFTMFDKNKKEYDFIKRVGERVFGIEGLSHKIKNQNVFQINFNSTIVGTVFFELFGKGFEHKKLPNLMFKLPTTSIYGLLAGLITTDGCISREGIISMQMSNKILTNQLYHLFRNRGIDISLHALKTPSKLATVQPYILAIPKIKEVLDQTYKYYEDNRMEICYKNMNTLTKNKSSPIIINDQKYLRINKIEQTDLNPEFVYTLGISEDHSYNVEGLVCENCYLLAIDDDLYNIFTKQTEIGMISKRAGGIGVHLSGIRSKGSLIRGTNGLSEGIIPLCSVLNKQSRYVNQGGKRPGSICCYLEPHHADIFEFVELRKQNTGTDDNRARDLFLALWTSNLFMKRVEEDQMWSLMCPDECPNLNKTYGEEYEKLYESYEARGMFVRQVKARELWRHIVECQIETGFPFMLYKDHVNEKSNQKNLGTICSSNLCCEICEYSDADNTAVCNLVSICLPRYINFVDGIPTFDYQKLIDVTRVAVRNLNKVIDINFYPSAEAKRSNKNNRPVGIGTQGLVDCYNIFGYAYESTEAEELNKKIYETIYYASVDESKELAKVHGTYKSFPGSPFSEGKLQFHLWGMNTDQLMTKNMYDWNKLVKEVKAYGTYNSLLTALMPTASTSQIMKCCESFEPYMSNVFVRTTMAGEFVVVNESLIKDLVKYNLWNEDMRKKIIIHNGSIQNIKEIPDKIKEVYKTAFEIKLKSIIKQSVERGPFIDQSQSMNLFMDNPSYVRLTSAHFYGWRNGIKTGMYYMRGAPAVNPIQFGIDMTETLRLSGFTNIKDYLEAQTNAKKRQEQTQPQQKLAPKMCKYVPGKKAEGCEMCSS